MANESRVDIVDHVKARYGAVAKSELSGRQDGVRSIAEAFGYSADDLAALPADANMGLSCGNPVATAHLKPSEVVVDLGCGGAMDVLLASTKVGPAGKAIGIDMTPEMIERARRNSVQFGKGTAPANVEFYHSRIERLPLPDNFVDCLISNCVLNLAPDKPAVFREMFRVLKPGGRVAVSDIALKRPLPPEIGQDIMAYVGCIAGAISMNDYRRWLQEAGFKAVQIIDTHKDLNAYSQAGAASCCGPAPASSSGLQVAEPSCCGGQAPLHDNLAQLLARYNINDYAASVQVFALK